MAIETKIDFMRQVEQAISDRVTAAEISGIMTALADTLEGYEMQKITVQTNDTNDLLACYIDALSVQNRSRKTIDRYKYIISRMMEYVNVPTRQITVYHLRNYLASEKARGVSDKTLEGYRQIYSAYFNWLQRESLIDRNPTANLGAVKCEKKVKRTYTEVDMELLNRQCKTLRDRAIINFLASTGCRISEMTGLNRDSVNLEALECVVHGKGNKERTVYISEVTGMLIGQYLNSRKDHEPALFIGKRNERLQPGGVRAMLNVIAKAAGVEHVHPHKFRRTLATELSRHGMGIHQIAAILGHEKIDTTMQYVVLNKDDVKSSYRRFA